MKTYYEPKSRFWRFRSRSFGEEATYRMGRAYARVRDCDNGVSYWVVSVGGDKVAGGVISGGDDPYGEALHSVEQTLVREGYLYRGLFDEQEAAGSK